MKNIFERIGKYININKLNLLICKSYNLDTYKSYKIITVGCDDFCYFLKTRTKKYVVKIFNKRKSLEDIIRFEDTYKIYIKNEIPCPLLLKNNYKNYISYLKFQGIDITLCLLEYIDGKDLYTINKKIDTHTIDKLVDILVSIHSIKENYKIEYDRYSFMKLKEVFQEHKDCISKKTYNEITKFLELYEKVDFSKLPICFIHADLASSNILKTKNNELFVIDFLQSGTGIRLLDIVIIINRCIFNYKYINYSKKMIKYFLKKYQEHIKLTEYELNVLPILEKANAYSFLILESINLNSKHEKKCYKNDLNFIRNIS